jgi:rare lipoprotein A
MTLYKSIVLLPLFIMAAVGNVLASEMLEGNASYYSDNLDGNKTASGEIYNKDKMTAAHRTLPFGTTIKVTYLKTGKSVEVVINDRGPHTRDRIIDLSGAAAEKVGLIDDGQGKVKLEIYEP